MSLFLYKVWAFLRRTIFSLTWWKTHWYLPWVFLVTVIVWTFTGGRGSAVSFIKTSQKIKEEEREKIKELQAKTTDKIRKLETSAKEKKERIAEETKIKIEEEKEKIKKRQELLRGDSEAINKELNDVLQD
jgi:biopolymer transport protein ExbB/TolQ